MVFGAAAETGSAWCIRAHTGAVFLEVAMKRAELAGRLHLSTIGSDPAEGTFFFFHISHLTSKIFFMVGSSASVTEKSSRIPPPSKCSIRVQVRQTNS